MRWEKKMTNIQGINQESDTWGLMMMMMMMVTLMKKIPFRVF